MNLAPVVDFLRQRIGLDAESLGPTALPRVINARMDDLAIASPTDYAARLGDDSNEFQKFINQIAVPETWFFRGGEVFSFLAGHATRLIRAWGNARKFHALSVPCSTGEEPYSLAIALTEAGVSSSTYQVEALDLCSQHLDKAERGSYSELSFRQTMPALRERYFQFQLGSWALNSAIRAQVRFQQANLLDPLFLATEEPFDLIFCRNLLIYLHKDARRRVLDTLDRLMAPNGWLCMGHAEPLEFFDPRFKRVGPENYFLYQRTETPSESQAPRFWSMHTPLPLDKKLSTASSPSMPIGKAIALEPLVVDRMANALHLADDGKLDEALATCRTQLAQIGPSADLFSLMGVVHQARHESEEAARCFQRALYLNPAHLDALTHLMLLCQEQGDVAQVERLRRRMERVARGGEA